MTPKFKPGDLIFAVRWGSEGMLVIRYNPASDPEGAWYDLLDGEEMITYDAMKLEERYEKASV